MSITSVGTSTQSATMGLIQGTGQVGGASLSQVMGQGPDQAQFSKGAQLMGKLKQLQSSDPEQFKAVAQKIADGLAAEADKTTDANAAAKFKEMSQRFAEAAKSGDMSSLAPPKPEAMAQAGEAGKLAMKYGANGGDHQAIFSTLDSVFENALSGTSDTSATSGTTGAAA